MEWLFFHHMPLAPRQDSGKRSPHTVRDHLGQCRSLPRFETCLEMQDRFGMDLTHAGLRDF